MFRATTAVRKVHARKQGIRAFEKGDLAQVAALYEAVMRSGTRIPPPQLAKYFERTFFDCPWADPEIPPLVFEEDDGRIAGFLGVHVRRVRLDGHSLRIVCGGQLISDPAARSRAIGAKLFRAHLFGPQAATIADGANETARQMWQVCGGETTPLKTISWTRVLRPARFAADLALKKLRRPALARRLRPLWRPLDALVTPRRLRPAAPQASAELLTPRAVLEQMAAVTPSLRCHPDYDEQFLEWVFQEMAAIRTRGTLVRQLVRDGGEPIGWYVYYLEDGMSEVLQVAAARGCTGQVLDHLLHHAYASGAAAVTGRLEPQLAEALSKRKCILRWSGTVLVHSRKPELLGVLLSSQCWLGRMDGDWWMGHHREAFA